MTYLPLTRLIAAAGGVVLPLMAGEALALPGAKSTSSINTQTVTSTLDPRESAPRTEEAAGSASSGNAWRSTNDHATGHSAFARTTDDRFARHGSS